MKKSQKINPDSSTFFMNEAKTNSFIKFIKHLMLIQKAVKKLRNRTKYRSLINVSEPVLEVLGDATYFTKNIPKNSFSFIKNKTFRFIVAKIKKYYQRKFKSLSIIQGKKLI